MTIPRARPARRRARQHRSNLGRTLACNGGPRATVGHARSSTAGGEVEQGRGGRRLKELRILRFSQISRVALQPLASIGPARSSAESPRSQPWLAGTGRPASGASTPRDRPGLPELLLPNRREAARAARAGLPPTVGGGWAADIASPERSAEDYLSPKLCALAAGRQLPAAGETSHLAIQRSPATSAEDLRLAPRTRPPPPSPAAQPVTFLDG